MQLLEPAQRDVPVTVTLKAETIMQIMVAAVSLPQIASDEFEKMAAAIKTTLIS